MRADTQQIKRALKTGKIEELFKEELGWNNLPEAPPKITYKGQSYLFKPLAQKANFKIYQHTFAGRIPEDRFLYQLDKGLNNFAIEHLTIFLDAGRENQVWVWVKKTQENDKQRSTPRLRKFNKQQSGDLLAQRLEILFVSLDEDDSMTLTSVMDRVKQGFDVEKVTKTFYGLFKEEHANFLKQIENIPNDDEHKEDREWYASIMLNRLMFIYFIQKKGLLDNHSAVRLDGDKDYLRERLRMTKEQHGPDNFYAFYRYFLLRLFHDGLNQPEPDHSSALKQIIGKIPYINGGLFDMHILEQRYPDIQIRDEAFEQVFAFFERFDWHLDDRPMRNDREINPDVLGYIFEKYINQKQMGAYYTKEDITEYISKNTIIPFLFEAVARLFPDAFVTSGPIWSLLKDHPEEYIYDAMTHGALELLPPEIEAGITDVAQRTFWNQSAPKQWTLPTETWREVVERRQRYEDVHTKMVRGEISTINDLITYNLDITQFARDVITECEDAGLLRAFYDTIRQITVLDPTCGSGAFLFAALNILKPLYQACLGRMRLLVDQYKVQHKNSNHITSFQQTLDHVEQHRSQEYFILKSIVINNLYGVDLMEEAVEICKLRLFLKLVAQVEKPQDLEPLPDIDFNVLAGNTLIGFTSLEEVRRVVTTKLVKMGDTEKTLQVIEEEAQAIERDEQSFRNMQTRQGMEIDYEVMSEHKKRLRKKLEKLRGRLDPYLATEYSIYEGKYSSKTAYENTYAQWSKSHKPFHWWAEFYKIMKDGGFDVIIGNPPYVEISDVKEQYSVNNLKLVSTGNLYSVCVERFLSLLPIQGHIGVIVPISSISTPRMLPLMRLLANNLVLYISNFAVRPGKLFVGVDMNLTILVGSIKQTQEEQKAFSTDYTRWLEAGRDSLFHTLSYYPARLVSTMSAYPKIGTQIEARLKEKISMYKSITRFQASYNTTPIYYHSGGRYFRKCIRKKLSNEYKEIRFRTGMDSIAICLLSSSLYYWLWIAQSDCYHVTIRDIEMLPVPDSLLTEPRLEGLADKLLADMEKNAEIRVRNRKDGSQRKEVNYKMRKSKPIIDEIDRVLAQHYGFTSEELDFIINYDIKYRMGRDNGEESEE